MFAPAVETGLDAITREEKVRVGENEEPSYRRATDLMRLQECYRVLELEPTASDEEVRQTYRDLSKVWHPDRFGSDEALRQKAEEKLRLINEAYARIRTERERGGRRASSAGDEGEERQDGMWRVRWKGRETRVRRLEDVIILAERGAIGAEAEVFEPQFARWRALRDFPELRAAVAGRQIRRFLRWAITTAVLGILILLRRPTPAGLIIALILFGLAFLFLRRMQRVE